MTRSDRTWRPATRRRAVCAAALGLGVLSAAPAAAETFDWQYATFITGNSALTIPVREWVESWDEQSEHDVNVEFFFQQALLQATEVLPGVADGRAAMGQTTTLYHPAETPLSQVVGIPFVTQDIEAEARAFNELYETNEAYRAEWDALGLHVITFVPIAGNVFGTTFPVETLSDLEGKRIRAAGLLSGAVEEAGATPVAMPAPEIYQALERGILDGWTANPFEITIKLGWHKVSPYYTDGGTGMFNLNVLIMNQETWEQVPDDLKELIEETRDDYLTRHVTYTIEQEEVACRQLLEEGGTPYVLPEEEIARWQEMVGDAPLEQWKQDVAARGVAEDVAQQFYDEYRAALAKYEQTSQYQTPPTERCVELAEQG